MKNIDLKTKLFEVYGDYISQPFSESENLFKKHDGYTFVFESLNNAGEIECVYDVLCAWFYFVKFGRKLIDIYPNRISIDHIEIDKSGKYVMVPEIDI